ncbi:MAG: TRAP transporter substrate-binding protein [Pseudomonadota bacterium]
MKQDPSNRPTRRTALAAGFGAAAAASLAAPARAADRISWKMVTSWPKNLPGPGVTAQRLCDRIAAMSDGRLTVRLFAAGELVSPFEVFGAVQGGTAEMGHTASFFWQGKLPAAALYTAAPFGLTPLEHIAWIDHGGGQALWDRLYEPFGIKPFMGGNTGFQMGGWFRSEVTGLDDFKGLKIRMPGLGGEVARQLGATPVSLPPSEILTALQTGMVDAAEFLGPWSDFAMGFYKAAKYYYYPGFHEPNGTGEALVSLKAFETLPDDLKAIVRHACAAENITALGESEWNNGHRLQVLTGEHGVLVKAYPDEVLSAARTAAETVLDDLARKDAISDDIVKSYRAARSRLIEWGAVSRGRYLAARAAG